MVKIQHTKTGEIREISREAWEKNSQYTNMRGSWTVVDPGDPVMLMYIDATTGHRKAGIVDRGHAEKLVGNGSRFYYLEVDAHDLQPTNSHVPSVKTDRQQRNAASQVKPEYTVKHISDSKHTIWDKIKYIGGVLGAIATMLTVLQQCSGKL